MGTDLNKEFKALEGKSEDYIKDNYAQIHPLLNELSRIIFNKYYSRRVTNHMLKDDMISGGVMKAYTALIAQSFEVSKGSLKNYLFTGIRNEMTNLLYRASKEISVDEIVGEESIGEVQVYNFSLDYKDIEELLVKINKGFIKPIVDNLQSMGIRVVNLPFMIPYPVEIDNFTRDAYIAYLFHKKLKY